MPTKTSTTGILTAVTGGRAVFGFAAIVAARLIGRIWLGSGSDAAQTYLVRLIGGRELLLSASLWATHGGQAGLSTMRTRLLAAHAVADTFDAVLAMTNTAAFGGSRRRIASALAAGFGWAVLGGAAIRRSKTVRPVQNAGPGRA